METQSSSTESQILVLSRFFFHLVYKVRLLRIAHGFSQEDLSILLGHEPNRIGCIERFVEGYGYVKKDLLRLTEVLACPLHQFFEQPATSDLGLIKACEHKVPGRISQEVYELRPNGSEVMLYKLVEVDHSRDQVPEALEINTKRLIGSLINRGYFDTPWETFEIFKVCRQEVGHQLKPHQLEQLLVFFTGSTGEVRLHRQPGKHHCFWTALPHSHR